MRKDVFIVKKTWWIKVYFKKKEIIIVKPKHFIPKCKRSITPKNIHDKPNCSFKKEDEFPFKQIKFVPTSKGNIISKINHQGPKTVSVPKNILISSVEMSANCHKKSLILGQWMLKTNVRR